MESLEVKKELESLEVKKELESLEVKKEEKKGREKAIEEGRNKSCSLCRS